jgi:hypothetical protein
MVKKKYKVTGTKVIGWISIVGGHWTFHRKVDDPHLSFCRNFVPNKTSTAYIFSSHKTGKVHSHVLLFQKNGMADSVE